MHSEAMQASMEQRSRSFPSDARQRLTNLQAQQSAQLSGHKVRTGIPRSSPYIYVEMHCSYNRHITQL